VAEEGGHFVSAILLGRAHEDLVGGIVGVPIGDGRAERGFVAKSQVVEGNVIYCGCVEDGAGIWYGSHL